MKFKKSVQAALRYLGIHVSWRPSKNFEKCWPLPRRTVLTDFERAEGFHQLYEEAQRATQMGDSDNALRRQRHYILQMAIQSVSDGEGQVAECGCWRGLSSYQIATYLESWSSPKFHIFDSFEGLSSFKAEDEGAHGVPSSNRLSVREQFACSLEAVRSNLQKFDFIEYHPGWIPERFSDVSKEAFAFVHIDVDMYQPTRDSLQFFFPRLVPGGLIVFDDYGFAGFPGARKAVDEYLGGVAGSEYRFLSTPSGSAVLTRLRAEGT